MLLGSILGGGILGLILSGVTGILTRRSGSAKLRIRRR
jgi:hypothetical protein